MGGEMPSMSVSIMRKDDPPVWPDLGGHPTVHVNHGEWKVALIEGGMQSGKTSVMLRLELPDGRELLAETSLASWVGVTVAARGAFPDEFLGGPLEVRDGNVDQ